MRGWGGILLSPPSESRSPCPRQSEQRAPLKGRGYGPWSLSVLFCFGGEGPELPFSTFSFLALFLISSSLSGLVFFLYFHWMAFGKLSPLLVFLIHRSVLTELLLFCNLQRQTMNSPRATLKLGYAFFKPEHPSPLSKSWWRWRFAEVSASSKILHLIALVWDSSQSSVRTAGPTHPPRWRSLAKP